MSLGPAALVSSLPGALGRTPRDELVIVGVSELVLNAAVILSVELYAITNDADADAAAQTVHEAVQAAQQDGARQVAVIVYGGDDPDTFSPDSTPARYAATAVVSAEAAGLGVLDAVAVLDGRWRSYDCTNPSCCPPEGSPIPGGPTP